MNHTDKKAIHKQLIDENEKLRKEFLLTERVPIFNKPSEHFCDRLQERVPKDERQNVVDMIVRYVDKNARTIAKRAGGEIVLNSKNYSVKLIVEPRNGRENVQDERDRPVNLITLVTIVNLI